MMTSSGSPAADRGMTVEPGSHPRSSSPKRWWRHGDSNPRHPACKAGALPTELYPRNAAAEPLEIVTRLVVVSLTAKTELYASRRTLRPFGHRDFIAYCIP
jgi:hypothetical protein